jgi:Holliday junction resolvase RusA-like endonuclease
MDHGWQTVLGQVPSKANSYKVITYKGHGSLGKTKALESYEKSFFLQCGKYRNLGISSFFEYHCRVYYKTMSSDLDNHAKIILDCLQKVKAISNDNRCIKIVAEKFVDKINPRIEFKLISVD